MGEKRPQTLENHPRLDPVYHFFVAPLSGIAFLAAVWHAIRDPNFVSLWLALAALLLFLAIFLLRTYALKVQDRVIRLEERLRLTALLPEAQRLRIPELTGGQLVALRFASDAELPALAIRAIDERLAGKDIKKSIRSWRADYLRV